MRQLFGMFRNHGRFSGTAGLPFASDEGQAYNLRMSARSPQLSSPAIRQCADALRRVSDYHLPPGVDRRLLYLSENKEALTAAEREELLALVEFAEDRTAEKLAAAASLKLLAEEFPDLASCAS